MISEMRRQRRKQAATRRCRQKVAGIPIVMYTLLYDSLVSLVRAQGQWWAQSVFFCMQVRSPRVYCLLRYSGQAAGAENESGHRRRCARIVPG